MSDKLKYSLNSYAVWCLVGYLLMAFFNWDFNAGNWPVGFRFVYILFGPVLGVFIGIIIFLWDKFEEEFSK